MFFFVSDPGPLPLFEFVLMTTIDLSFPRSLLYAFLIISSTGQSEWMLSHFLLDGAPPFRIDADGQGMPISSRHLFGPVLLDNRTPPVPTKTNDFDTK